MTIDMPSFELFVLGAGGGPLETNLSAYFLKEFNAPWENGIVGLEAGSGIGALTTLLDANPDLFGPIGHIKPPRLAAAKIFNYVHTYLITHAHMDHILGLVLTAGSSNSSRKKIVATDSVLSYVETVFQGKLWPQLASWEPVDMPHNYLLSPMNCDSQYHPVASNILVKAMPLSHGRTEHTSTSPDYPSLAYFVRHQPSSTEFLFFGDVEPDSISGATTSRNVWRTAAPLVLSGKLKAVFLECSWTAGRPDSMLYGHLNPRHFVEELRVLAKEVDLCKSGVQNNGERTYQYDLYYNNDNVANNHHPVPSPEEPPRKKRRGITSPTPTLAPSRSSSTTEPHDSPLRGLRIFVIHCKEPMEDIRDTRPMHVIISEQIKEELGADDMGVEISAVEQGMRIYI